MVRFVLFIFVLAVSMNVSGQVRNGWRSVYDKEGRLTRMNYFDNGRNVADSSMLFQYYTDNVLKGYIMGEVATQTGEVNGLVALFDQTGNLISFANKVKGETVFDVRCDFEQKCKAIWIDEFNQMNNDWECGDYSTYDGEMIIHNQSLIGTAIYKPDVSINLAEPFLCKIEIPVEGNSAKQAIALGWKDADNFLLFEVSFGTYFNVYDCKDGNYNDLTAGRKKIENPSATSNNLVLTYNGTNIIFEINGKIEMIVPNPKFENNKVALITRARGDARFSSFMFSSDVEENDHFYEEVWIGKGTGFFITPNRILTTFDVVSDARMLRIRTKINNIERLLPVKVFRVEESNNLAILSVEDPDFNAFDVLPYGFSGSIPVSESTIWSLGFPNAISTIYMPPETYEGSVLPTTSMTAGYRLLELPFRFGMMGAPAFDKDANLIGVVAYKGLDLKYSEIIDFHDNSRLFKANLGRFDRSIESPLRALPLQEKIKKLSEIVVIVESNVFGEHAIQY